MSDEYYRGRQPTGNHNWGDPFPHNRCSICDGIGARATCTKCHNTCHAYCSKVVKRERVCERCLVAKPVARPVEKKHPKLHWWKCQNCGVTFERVTKGKPRSCPLCKDRGRKDYRGYKRRDEASVR